MDYDSFLLKVLLFIRLHNKRGVSLRQLREKFGTDANAFLVQLLVQDGYAVLMKSQFFPVKPSEVEEAIMHPEYRLYCTHKGNALIEQRRFDFWKWVVPTLISVAALIVAIAK